MFSPREGNIQFPELFSYKHMETVKKPSHSTYQQSNSVITSSKERHKLCHYKRTSLQVRCMVKVTEKYFKTKYRHAGLLLHVNAKIYFKFKLQLKFINNKNYSSVIVNFHRGLG